ncbi:MAG TPA: metallophosphoesterase, partial [Gaiellaceae bacterium]|nr:metallophosphoesterase [Gaiellaceae bacterium]
MTLRVLHVSDLHFGARKAIHEPEAEDGVRALLERVDPVLVLATGDLTHRGRREEHAAAAQFLRSLGVPLVVVPGNHDIP